MGCFKVSIVISVYNGEQTLDRCFQSIQKQIFQDFEIVCINDGSTDKSSEIINKWRDILGEDRFKLSDNNTCIGLTKSLNKGLWLASGYYIARIDADDFWYIDKLEKQVNFLEKNKDYGIIGCNYINIFKNNTAAKEVRMHETDEEIKKKIFHRNPFAHSCIMARKEIIEKAGNYDENVICGQDYDLWLRCLPLTKFYNLQEFLCKRLVSDGISVQKQNTQMMQCIKTIIKYIKKYRYPWTNYFYILEPLIIILLPKFIKDLKRKNI